MAYNNDYTLRSYNTLFGVANKYIPDRTTDFEDLLGNDLFNKPLAKDKILRETKTGKDVFKLKGIAESLDPDNQPYYYQARRIAIVRYANELKDYYREQIAYALKRGYSQNQANIYATKKMDKRRTELMNLINEQFPAL